MSPDSDRAPLIEFSNLTVYREDTRVLDRFSLTIPAGQHVAILGPNGSGKSTLVKLVTRELYPVVAPDASLRVLGRDRWMLFQLRKHIGIVSNDLMAMCTRAMTGRDLVVSAFFGSVGVWPHHAVSQEMRDKAADAMAIMEVSHLSHRVITELSSGEARRLLVARALAHQPQALVLDEPTNSLDLRAYRDFTACLSRLARQGTALILVTHHLPDIVPEIDRVVVLADGRVQHDGPKRAILRADILSGAFGVPVDVQERDGFFTAW